MKLSSFPLSFGLTLPDSFKNEISGRPMHYAFKRYRIRSSFVLKYSGTYITIGLMIAFGCTFKLISLLFKKLKYPNLQFIAQRLQIIFLWNMVLIILISSLPNFVISSMVFL